MNQNIFTLTKRKVKQILICLSFFTFIAVLPEANSTHLLGGEITYECIGPNNYKVTLVLYRDCDGISLSSNRTLRYLGCSSSGGFNVSRTEIVDITPLCPGETSSCNGGSVEGVERHIYVGVLNLHSACSAYVLSYDDCCRNHDITTLDDADSQDFYVYTDLHNVAADCNNSPVFNNNASAYGCVNEVLYYNHGVTDVDGDVLVFSLTNCLQGPTTSVVYNAGYSGVTPLSSTGGVSINSATGAISFTPDIEQVGVLCVLVEEFRGGVKIGEVVRDIQFNIEDCSGVVGGNTSPTAAGPYLYNVNPGTQICFNIVGSDSDVGDKVLMSTNNGIPSGAFTPALPQGYFTNPSTQFCWTPTNADENATHFFTITVQDDACPLVGQNTYTYQVVVGSACSLSITCPDDISVDSGSSMCGANVSFDDPVFPSGCSGATYVCTIPDESTSSCAAGQIDLTFVFDDFPSETSWEITTAGGVLIGVGGTYGGQPAGSTLIISGNLLVGDYILTIFDRYGDGMCCAYGYGSYSLTSNGNTLAAGGSFGASESTAFCVEALGAPIVVSSGDFFPVGTTTVTCTATEGTQTASCTFDVTVTDVTSPILSMECPGDITECGAQNINWTPPTATDNCGIVSVNNNYSPGDNFSVGTHTVTYTFFDAAGLSASCSFTVTINPLPAVTITQTNLPTWCQGIKVLTANVGNPGDLTYPLVFAWSDGLGSDPVVVVPANGTYYVTVTDDLGCASVATTVVNENISTLFSAYTIISGEELEMFESQVYSGGVGIEDAEEAVVRENSNIHTFMRANMSGVDIDGSSTVNNPIDADYAIPFPYFQSNPFYDNNNITVPANTAMTLSGSHYGNVSVGSGATLHIDSPSVYMKSLTTANNVTIHFHYSTNLKIQRKMKIGERNVINSSAHTSVIYVGDKASIKEGSTVIVNIYAPEGLEVNDSGSSNYTYMTGTFISNDRVTSDYYVIWNWNLNCSSVGAAAPLMEAIGGEHEDLSNTVEKQGLTVYPNPTTGILNIDVSDYLNENVTVNIYDPLGRVVWTRNIDEVDNTVIRANLTSSEFINQLYLLSVQDSEGVTTKLFILNK